MRGIRTHRTPYADSNPRTDSHRQRVSYAVSACPSHLNLSLHSNLYPLPNLHANFNIHSPPNLHTNGHPHA